MDGFLQGMQFEYAARFVRIGFEAAMKVHSPQHRIILSRTLIVFAFPRECLSFGKRDVGILKPSSHLVGYPCIVFFALFSRCEPH